MVSGKLSPQIFHGPVFHTDFAYRRAPNIRLLVRNAFLQLDFDGITFGKKSKAGRKTANAVHAPIDPVYLRFSGLHREKRTDLEVEMQTVRTASKFCEPSHVPFRPR